MEDISIAKPVQQPAYSEFRRSIDAANRRPKPAPVAKAADARKPAAAKADAVAKPATVATPTPVSVATPPAAAAAALVPAPVAPPAVASDLVQALHQQSQVLTRLAIELDAQRIVIADQQAAIKTLETRGAATASPAAAAKAPAPVPAPIVLVDTSGAKLRMGGLIQGWFTFSDGGVVNSFRLRRTELKISGEINPRAKWTFMIDPAKSLGVSNSYVTVNGQKVVADTAVSQSGRLLQDAFLSLTYSPKFAVEVGQQKIPLGMEGVQSSGKLDIVERALFMTDKARGGGYADVRDLGVIARGKLAGGQVEYSGGVFNGLGESMNDVDKNHEKPFVGRVVMRPRAVRGLQFGGSMARASFKTSDATRRDRGGLEASFTRGLFNARSEMMFAQDALTPRLGYYIHTGARVFTAVEAVFRYDVFDPDTRGEATAATVTERDLLGGVNWFIAGPNVMLQFDYVRKTFASVRVPRNVFMTNLQTSW